MPLGPNEPCWCLSGQKYKRCHRGREVPVVAGTVSPMRTLPDSIERPDYARTGQPAPGRGVAIHDADGIARMRHACAIAADLLQLVGAAVAPGVTTDELDALTHEECIRLGVYPSPLNYRGYPKSLCTSVNEVICHGIPDDRALADGDIVNLDVTVYVDGVHGDTNATFLVGDVDEGSRRLVAATRECLERGIAAVAPGRPVSVIGKAIEACADDYGYGVVHTFAGHGIGRQFHCEPTVPHYHDRRARMEMVPGMTFTIEPMIAIGVGNERIWADGWTAVTADGLRTAQFEHTILVTDTGAEILPLPAGERAASAGAGGAADQRSS